MAFKLFLITLVILIQMTFTVVSCAEMNEQKKARGIHYNLEAEEAKKMGISEGEENHAREKYFQRGGYIHDKPPTYCQYDNDCAEWGQTCQLNGFNDPYCDPLKRQCSCGTCDPCNCALYCSDKRLNKLYGSGLTVGTCQCGSSKNGESYCRALETQCVCSSPPPHGCNYNTNHCCQPVGGSETECGSDCGSKSGTESGSESGSKSGTESGCGSDCESKSGTESGSNSDSDSGKETRSSEGEGFIKPK